MTAESPSTNRMLLIGAVAWLAFSAAYVMINGVVFDESVMQAQVLSGAVQYPSDHPTDIYFRQAYNLPGYVATVMMKIGLGVTEISASRNVAFLFLSMFVPFSFTILLTRSIVFGILATALVATESVVFFSGRYPVFVFPHFYSLGHIGMQMSLLAVALVLGGLWRSAGGLLGILPLIHPTLAIIVWVWSGLFLLLGRAQSTLRQRVFFVSSFGIGLLILATVLLLAYLIFNPGGPALTPGQHLYAQTIYGTFTSNFDFHRREFDLTTFGYLVNPIFFGVAGALILWNLGGRPDPNLKSVRKLVTWLLILGAISWVIVYAARVAVLYVDVLPTAVNISMPFRLSNITAMLLIPFTMAAFYHVQKNMSEVSRNVTWLFLTGLLIGAGTYLALSGSSDHLLVRLMGRAFHPQLLMFGAWGLLLAGEVIGKYDSGTRGRYAWALISVAIGATLLAAFPRPATMFIATFVAAGLVYFAGNLQVRGIMSASRKLDSFRMPAMASAAVLVTVVTVFNAGIWENRTILQTAGDAGLKWYEYTEFDGVLNSWLAANADPNEMILAAICCDRSITQVRTGHPTVIDWETVYMMSYIPDLALPIGQIVNDLYEVDFSDKEKFDNWTSTWESRNVKDWQILGERYNFRLILSQTDVPLRLPTQVSGPIWTLYTIPDGPPSALLEGQGADGNIAGRMFN